MRYLTYEQMNLINAFRMINLNGAIYAMLMGECLANDTPCYEAAYSRLLMVPKEVFVIISHYYDEKDAAKIYNLTMQNIILMNKLASNLVEKNEEGAIVAMEQWKKNIDLLSEAYAVLNPYWSKEQWESLLTTDIQLTYQSMHAIITDDCARSLAIFDRIKAHAIVIGDYQARGIIRSMALPGGFD